MVFDHSSFSPERSPFIPDLPVRNILYFPTGRRNRLLRFQFETQRRFFNQNFSIGCKSISQQTVVMPLNSHHQLFIGRENLIKLGKILSPNAVPLQPNEQQQNKFYFHGPRTVDHHLSGKYKNKKKVSITETFFFLNKCV